LKRSARKRSARILNDRQRSAKEEWKGGGMEEWERGMASSYRQVGKSNVNQRCKLELVFDNHPSVLPFFRPSVSSLPIVADR
jgi:hypothetical protein